MVTLFILELPDAANAGKVPRQQTIMASRHKKPVIIVPYYKDTREEEIVKKMFESYNKKFIRTIKTISEIFK